MTLKLNGISGSPYPGRSVNGGRIGTLGTPMAAAAASASLSWFASSAAAVGEPPLRAKSFKSTLFLGETTLQHLSRSAPLGGGVSAL